MQSTNTHHHAARSRTRFGAAVIAVGTLLAGIGMSSGATEAYDAGNPIVTPFTPESNSASWWGAGCTKLDQGNGSNSYTATAYHGIIVLKSGNFNYAFYNVEPGDVLTIPQQISHFIFCPPAATTTTVAETTTTVADTTTTVAETTTTVAETTTTVADTTTTVAETTTTVAETTTTVADTTTTVPDETTTTVADTTTTVAEETTTSVASAGPTTTVVAPFVPTTLSASGAATTIAAELPATGTDTTSLLTLIGAGLFVLGLGLVISARRPELA